MVKHIVLWKIKDLVEGRSKKGSILLLKEALEGLRGKIPQIQALEVGVNFNPAETASDLSLYTEFKDREDLDLYQQHPEHLKVVELVKKHASERRVSDYET